MSTCPNPTNDLLTPLNGNNFSFGIQKVPEVSWNVQKVQIPSVRLEPAIMDTPMIDVNFRGGKLEYGDLTITFIVDSAFENYLKLYNWMVRTCDDSKCFSNTDNLYDHEFETEGWTVSDAFLNVMKPNKTDVLYSIKFVDLMPTSMSQIDFDTLSSDVASVVCEAEFKFSYFVFAKHNISVTQIQ